jgi:hypothetical protein
MVMEHLELEPKRIVSFITSFCGGEIRLFDGQIKEVAHIGLGCVLISRKVLERIKFRLDTTRNYHPDTYFHEDCKRINIPTYLDSSILCRHENRRWGIHGIDFN